MKIEVPAGTTLYKGKAAPQVGDKKPFENVLGGGDQIVIPRENLNPKWFEAGETYDFRN